MDITQYLSPDTVFYLTRLSLALVLGMLIGVERVLAHKTAGMRTYALVSMGSALFVIVGEAMSAIYLAKGINPDPLKMAANVIAGIGFIGAGLIIFKNSHLLGLTTASGLWVAAGIGIAVGFGLFELAIMATALTLLIFTVLWFVEERIRHLNGDGEGING